MPTLRLASLSLCGSLLLAAANAQTSVFANDFDGAVPPQMSAGQAALEAVQGFAGYGPAGDQFGGTFLRSPTGNAVTLTLTGLPPHNVVHLEFLFAAIDSLDGTGTFPSGDFFEVAIDGNTFFRESFANASPSQIQSYVPAPGVELARFADLGFSGPGGYYTDSAYRMGAEPRFHGIGHAASTLTVRFEIVGPGIQSLSDESWALDNLRVLVDTVTNPGSTVAYGTTCGPTLTALGAPRIGQTLSLLMQNLPPNTLVPALAVGLSATSAGTVPLPLPLDFLGAPGCLLLHDAAVDTGASMLLQGSAATAAIAVPPNPVFVGFTFFLQGWTFAPGVNALGVVFSGGLQVQIGQ